MSSVRAPTALVFSARGLRGAPRSGRSIRRHSHSLSLTEVTPTSAYFVGQRISVRLAPRRPRGSVPILTPCIEKHIMYLSLVPVFLRALLVPRLELLAVASLFCAFGSAVLSMSSFSKARVQWIRCGSRTLQESSGECSGCSRVQ